MPKSKSIVLVGIFLFSLLSLISFLGWALNLYSSIISIGALGTSAESKMQERITFDWIPSSSLNYFLTIDLSTVSTLVIVITSCWAFWGMVLLYRFGFDNSNADKINRTHFPFWSTYKTTFIELGLLGTIFAFIIAFGQAEVRHNTEILLKALGTALWSTFSAILFAYVVCPVIIEKPFACLSRKIVGDGNDEGDEDIEEDVLNMAQAFGTLFDKINLAANALEGFTEELNDIESIQQALRQIYQLRDEFTTLHKNQIMDNQQLSEIKDELARLRDVRLENQQKQISELKNQLVLQFDQLNEQIRNIDTQNQQNSNQINQKLSNSIQQLKTVERKIEDYEKTRHIIKKVKIDLNKLKDDE